jgi:hypothetical protein
MKEEHIICWKYVWEKCKEKNKNHSQSLISFQSVIYFLLMGLYPNDLNHITSQRSHF